MSVRHWGPHFPDAASATVKHWSVHFPDGGIDPTIFPGYGPPGVGTLAFTLEQGFTLTHTWITDVQKMRSGKERRVSRNDAPKQNYAGSVVLLGTNARALRTKLGRYAASGSQFLLGLPHEEMVLSADASGTSVFVPTLTLCDWAKPGQRVAVVREDATGELASVSAIIQSASAGTIVLDVAPGAVGLAGGRIMPVMAVYLESQQDLDRDQLGNETWHITARAAMFDFAPTLATLAVGPITTSAGIDNLVLMSRIFGQTAVFARFVDSGSFPAGGYGELGNIATVFFQSGVTTVAQIEALVDSQSNLIKFTGSWTGGAVLQAGDAFGITQFTGAGVSGDVGTGATLTTATLDGTSRPVWDRPLLLDNTIAEPVIAMTKIIDHGGVPYSVATADQSDWGRTVIYRRDQRAEWQWWKLFTSTTKGPQKAFWLPTWVNDLPFVSKAAGTITVTIDDFAAWWPAQRQYIQIAETSGTVTYAKVSAAVNNGSGTWTLSIVDPANAPITIASSNVLLVSWLELCRWEGDEFQVSWGQRGFSFEHKARAVQQ